MKIIQICGTNGTGKTTLVKNFLKKGAFHKMKGNIPGKEFVWWYNGSVAVIGNYKSTSCCGIDGGKFTGETLLNAVKSIGTIYRPEIVLFEDVLIGSSYAFKARVFEYARETGSEYAVLALTAPFEVLTNRIIERSGNTDRHFDNIRSKGRQIIASTKRIRDDGAEAVFCDTSKAPPESVLKLLERLCYEKA